MSTSVVATISSSLIPTPVSTSTTSDVFDDVPAHHASPVVAFIIGLGIVTLASIMNAAGLNLTKLDHVRTSAIPKAERRRDWLRPLWLLGMVLYMLSQLIGSTLALEYMRAEYVAPLGSTSLIFNFLFAKFLVNSPVTNTDIYGTIIVIIGVIGIVAFGSINSGLAQETDVAHLTYLWTRGNWLGYFFVMAFALIFLFIFTTQLDAVLAARSDLSAIPFSSVDLSTMWTRSRNPFSRLASAWNVVMLRVRGYLEDWTASHDDKRIAWTLGIGWACCGGGLAGGTLVFAKAAVKLISGSLSHENTGNQFGQASSIFTFLLLAVTAVCQIICLNRGLKVYDSTLVVPVFYGVYTAVGFLDSLIFNNEVDAYQSWALFLIFCSILTLVSGVVLLTNKKPDPKARPGSAGADGTSQMVSLPSRARRRTRARGIKVTDEEEGLREVDEADEGAVVWELGEASDDDDPPMVSHAVPTRSRGVSFNADGGSHLERSPMIADHATDPENHRESTSSDATLTRPDTETGGFVDDDFGAWEDQGKTLR